jgi:hypothetical protein
VSAVSALHFVPAAAVGGLQGEAIVIGDGWKNFSYRASLGVLSGKTFLAPVAGCSLTLHRARKIQRILPS